MWNMAFFKGERIVNTTFRLAVISRGETEGIGSGDTQCVSSSMPSNLNSGFPSVYLTFHVCILNIIFKLLEIIAKIVVTIGKPLFLLGILHIFTPGVGEWGVTGLENWIFAEDPQLVNSELCP